MEYLQYKSTFIVVFWGDASNVLSAVQVYIAAKCALVAFLITNVRDLVGAEFSPALNVANTLSPWSHWILGVGYPKTKLVINGRIQRASIVHE